MRLDGGGRYNELHSLPAGWYASIRPRVLAMWSWSS